MLGLSLWVLRKEFMKRVRKILTYTLWMLSWPEGPGLPDTPGYLKVPFGNEKGFWVI